MSSSANVVPAEYSIVLAGKYGVGKSSIFKKLRTGLVPEGVVEGTSRTTKTWGEDEEGLDSFVYQRQIADERNVKVTLWDTGGQERFNTSMTANYYRNAHGVILVYALDEESTLYSLNELVGEAKGMSRQGEKLVFALWGSKSDLPVHMQTVLPDAVNAMLSTHHIPQELNCKVNVLDHSVEEAMLTLIQEIDQQFTRLGPAVTNRDSKAFDLTPPPTTPAQQKWNCCRISS